MVEGHDVEALSKAFYDASTVKGRPTCILAKTFKGKGIPGIKKKIIVKEHQDFFIIVSYIVSPGLGLNSFPPDATT